jgi:tetratricopeptide (TPR) repeat protein
MPESSQRSELELTLLLALGPVINVTKGWSSPAVEAVYERAHDLCQQLEETPQLFAALFGLAAHYYVRGEYKPARENTKKSLSLARRSGDSNMILQAYHLLGNLQTYTGDLVTACQSLDEVITRYRSETHHPLINLYGGDDPAVCCLSHKAWAVWLLGYPDQSVQIAQRAVSLAQKLDHPGSLALAFAFMAMLFGFRRERARALDAARCAVLVCKERGLSFFDEIAEFAQAAFTPERTTAHGVKKIRKIVESSEPWNRALRLAMLAEAAFDGSHYHQASAALCEALAVVDGKGERMWEAELFRLRGELGKADQEGAKSDFLRAIATARSQQTRSLELRATTSLARLLAKQGRRDEARTMLGEIYGWFTEGFDTADLKDAKALLDQLSG